MAGRVAILLEKANDKCCSWDMAFKDKSESDFVCGLALARVGADIHILHAIHDRPSFTASKQAVKTGAAKFPRIVAKLVEDTAAYARGSCYRATSRRSKFTRLQKSCRSVASEAANFRALAQDFVAVRHGWKSPPCLGRVVGGGPCPSPTHA
jgi:phage terminase large subunit-like protein